MTAQADPRFERYFTSNDQPSAEDLKGIRSYIAGPKQELEEITREIEALESRLTALRARRETLNGLVQKYTGICSPIRRLPQDILGEIFFLCLPTDRFSALHVRDIPLLFTIVCRRWREVTFDEPRLWTSFHVVTNFDDSKPGSPVSDEEHLRYAAEQAAFLQGYVSRSGKVPLHISIADRRSGYEPDNPPLIVSLLGQLLPRIQSLRWDSQCFHDFVASHTVESFPLLERVCVYWQSGSFDPMEPPSYLLAPKLHDVRIHDFNSCQSKLPLQWNRLTRLSLPGSEHVISAEALARTLKSCPKLQEGLFYVTGDSSVEDSKRSITLNSVPLHELWSLHITHQDCVGALLRQLHVPKLTQLVLKGDREELFHPTHPSCLPSLIEHNEECLPYLETLVVRPSMYNPGTLITALERLPRLRALILVDKNGISCYSSHVRKHLRREFDEDMLVRMTPEVPPLSDALEHSTLIPSCLCPLLERFEFREGANYVENRHLSINTVVSFVTGKWEAARAYPGRFSALKHITLPTRTLPNDSVEHALRPWRERGLVVEIAHPALNATYKPGRWYEGITEIPLPEVASW